MFETLLESISFYLRVPSSVTIPRPSALFCLSNAFKSRTLIIKEKKNNSRKSGKRTAVNNGKSFSSTKFLEAFNYNP